MRVTYEGRWGAIEVDGIRIEQGAEADLTDEQFERVKHRGVTPVDGAVEPSGRTRRRLAEERFGAGVTEPQHDEQDSGGEPAGEE